MKYAELLIESNEPIDLGVGDPSDSVPQILTEELANWTRNPRASHYPNPIGEPEFVDAIVDYYRRTQGISLDGKAQVCVTHGARPALLFSLLSLHRPGAPVGYLSPAYCAFQPIIRKAGMVPKPIAVETWFGSKIELESSLNELRGGALLLNNPHNPTGLVFSAIDLEVLASMTEEKDIKVVSDAVYSELYESSIGAPETYLRYQPNAIEAMSISKTFRACGWRVGAVVGDAKWISEFIQLYQEMNGVPYAVQQTAASALNAMTDVVRFRYEIAQRRAVLIDGLRNQGFLIDSYIQNVAGLFVWAGLPQGSFASSADAATRFAETRVMMSPGSDFGLGGEGFLRLSLNVEAHQLREAIERISNVLKRR